MAITGISYCNCLNLHPQFCIKHYNLNIASLHGQFCQNSFAHLISIILLQRLNKVITKYSLKEMIRNSELK